MNGPIHLRDLITVQSAVRGDRIALRAPGREPLDYRTWAAQTREVGRTLRAWGLGPDDRVALALPSGPDLAAAFFEVAAYAQAAPLNPALRAAEFDHFLTDLRARAVIVPAGDGGTAAEVAGARGIAVIELVPDPSVAGVFTLRGDAIGPAVDVRPGRPEDVGLILYTSGTIARPRRVPLTHTNLLVAAANTGRAFALGPADSCLNLMPLFHAHGLTSTLLASVVYGASVICPPKFDATLFFDWLREFRPTWYTAVPAMHRALLDAAPAHGTLDAGLRVIRSASAPLPSVVLAELERAFGAPVIEAYGMTEAASLVTSNPLPPGVRKERSVGLPVGAPVRILDRAGTELRTGERGEIAICGANVMHGYGDDPAANAAAFAGDWLRTGDYGYLDDDGYLFVVGRVKEIINRGGAKVSPAEVDEALAGHPGLAQAVAFGLPHETLGEDLAVAVVPKPGVVVTEADVRAFAVDRLSDHKVPSRVFVVEDVPRNATGKVRRLKLAEQFARSRETPAVVPGTGTETAVAAIWANVLDLTQVDVTTSFFDLRGDSLAMATVARRLREDLGHDVAVSVLLMHPTVRSLAALLDERGTRPAPPAIDPDAVAAGRDRLLNQRARLRENR